MEYYFGRRGNVVQEQQNSSEVLQLLLKWDCLKLKRWRSITINRVFGRWKMERFASLQEIRLTPEGSMELKNQYFSK